MDIQFVGLEDDVCKRVNETALERGVTVSSLVNEILRRQFEQARESK